MIFEYMSCLLPGEDLYVVVDNLGVKRWVQVAQCDDKMSPAVAPLLQKVQKVVGSTSPRWKSRLILHFFRFLSVDNSTEIGNDVLCTDGAHDIFPVVVDYGVEMIVISGHLHFAIVHLHGLYTKCVPALRQAVTTSKGECISRYQLQYCNILSN